MALVGVGDGGEKEAEVVSVRDVNERDREREGDKEGDALKVWVPRGDAEHVEERVREPVEKVQLGERLQVAVVLADRVGECDSLHVADPDRVRVEGVKVPAVHEGVAVREVDRVEVAERVWTKESDGLKEDVREWDHEVVRLWDSVPVVEGVGVGVLLLDADKAENEAVSVDLDGDRDAWDQEGEGLGDKLGVPLTLGVGVIKEDGERLRELEGLVVRLAVEELVLIGSHVGVGLLERVPVAVNEGRAQDLFHKKLSSPVLPY